MSGVPTSWPGDPRALARAQKALAGAAPAPWEPTGADVVGASACAFAPGPVLRPRPGATGGGEPGWAAACRWEPGKGEPGEVVVAAGPAGAAYVPGQLALREGHLREVALRRLSRPPEVVLVNATGRDHPRGAGLALHLGAVVGVATVGVTDRPLVAEGDPPAGAAGARSPLRYGGAVVGWWLRTRRGVRPVAVHAGWRTTPAVAAEVVLACVRGVRMPEPLRVARQAARRARSRPGSG